MFEGTCKRGDRSMAGVVNTALSMQRVVGRNAAYDYLVRHHVPAKVITRALSGAGRKREHHEKNLGPDAEPGSPPDLQSDVASVRTG